MSLILSDKLVRTSFHFLVIVERVSYFPLTSLGPRDYRYELFFGKENSQGKLGPVTFRHP